MSNKVNASTTKSLINNKDVGKRLEELRISEIEDGEVLTKTKLEEKLGFCKGIISKYELGKRQITLIPLLKYVDKFHVSMDYIILGNQSTNTDNEENTQCNTISSTKVTQTQQIVKKARSHVDRGIKLRELRVAKNYTQEEVAKKMEFWLSRNDYSPKLYVTKKSIARMESGESKYISSSRLMALASIYGCTLDEICFCE